MRSWARARSLRASGFKELRNTQSVGGKRGGGSGRAGPRAIAEPGGEEVKRRSLDGGGALRQDVLSESDALGHGEGGELRAREGLRVGWIWLSAEEKKREQPGRK